MFEQIKLGDIKKENLEELEKVINLGVKEAPFPSETGHIKKYLNIRSLSKLFPLNNTAKIIEVRDTFTKLKEFTNSNLLELLDIVYEIASTQVAIDAEVRVDSHFQVHYMSRNTIGQKLLPYIKKHVESVLEK